MFLSLYMSVHFTSTINSVTGKSVIRATLPVFVVSEVVLPRHRCRSLCRWSISIKILLPVLTVSYFFADRYHSIDMFVTTICEHQRDSCRGMTLCRPTAVRAETVLKWRCSLCRANIKVQAFAVLTLGHGLCFHHVRSTCLAVLKGRREACFFGVEIA